MSELIFDKYEIIRRLALGGMGEVFLARELSGIVDRFVILKSLLPELAEQDGFVEQFLDEARVAATLNHPNIVSIYEVGLWQGVYYIAMEFIHGGDLSRLQKAAGKKGVGIPFQVSARIIMDAASGMDHAHSATNVQGTALEIVHRDISPQNIMVRGDGVTKVVDFGIAKAANRETRTKTGMLKGKLQYMPPEQIHSAELDGRSDQFSLGVVLWEMCMGRRLFKGDNEIQTLERVLKAPIEKPSDVINGFPEKLEGVIMRMLQRDPGKRFPSMAEVAESLRHYLDACEKQAGQQDVAKFVQEILGDELAESTRNIAPSKENFLISLEQSSPFDQITPTMNRALVKKKRRSRTLAISAALLCAAAAAAVLFWPSEDTGLTEVPIVLEKPGLVFDRVKRTLSFTTPVGAVIYLNGREHDEKVPSTLLLASGDNHVEVRLANRSLLREVFSTDADAPPPEAEKKTVEHTVTTTPLGASLYVDDEKRGITPLTLRLEEGQTLNARLERAGYADVDLVLKGDEEAKNTKVTLKKLNPALALKNKRARAARLKKERQEDAALKKKLRDRKDKLAAAEKAREAEGRKAQAAADKSAKEAAEKRRVASLKPGKLRLDTVPWSRVSIDGKAVGSTPIVNHPLKPGKHRLTFVNTKDGIRKSMTVTIQSGKTNNLKSIDLLKLK